MTPKSFKLKPQKIPLQTSLTTIRAFSYKKNEVELNFNLNIDNKKEPRAFLECLEQAVIDVKSAMEE